MKQSALCLKHPGPIVSATSRRSENAKRLIVVNSISFKLGGSATAMASSPAIPQIADPIQDSLIRVKNSLISDLSSLQGRKKFPVPMRRELARKPRV
jgi:hypothetical protein